MQSGLNEPTAARLAVQVVVTIVQFHHPRARTLGHAVAQCLERLGAERSRAEWQRLIGAYNVLARELTQHMKEEEELVFDQVQFLAVRSRLAFGALSSSRRDFEALISEHGKLSVLRKRLGDELHATAPLHTQSDAAAALRSAIKEFLTAHLEHLEFENDALVPTLAPFLEG